MVLGKIGESFSDAFKSKEELDLTEGPVGKNLFYLALPVIVTNLLRTAYNIADTFWLGQYSGDALAAITFAFPLVFFLISLGMGLAVAGSVLIAQYEGKGDRRSVNFAASQTVTFSALASVVLGFAGYFFIGDLVKLLGAKGAVAASATGYMQIISLGLFAMFGFAVFMSMMRGFGDTVTPMLLMLATVILNIIIDPFFIFGWWIFPEMGVEGAAVATILSRFLSLGVALRILFSGRKGVEVTLSKMKPDLEYFRKMINIGIPASVEGVGRSVSVNLLVAVVGWMFASQVVAGYGIGVRIFSLVFLPAIAVGRAVESMSGQNLGAGNFERAGKTARVGAKYSFLVLTALGVLTLFFARPIASIFTKDPEIAAVAAEFLIYVSLTFGGIGVLRSFSGIFRGAGKTLVAAAIAVSTLGLIRLPISYIGAIHLGTRGVWIGFIASNILGAAIAYLLYRRGSWKQRVTEEDRRKGQVAEETDDYGETITDSAAEKLRSMASSITDTLPF
ncbi:MAG: MATE family efflux transporter [Candidatus Nanosalina sp.]